MDAVHMGEMPYESVFGVSDFRFFDRAASDGGSRWALPRKQRAHRAVKADADEGMPRTIPSETGRLPSAPLRLARRRRSL